MKADQQTQAGVIVALKGMAEAYAKRDLAGMLSFWAPDPDVLVIGSGADERSIGQTEFGKSSKRDWAQSEAATIEFGDFKVSAVDSVAWFAVATVFHARISGKESNVSGTSTGVLEKRNGKWLLMQMHFSVPSTVQAEGESWPKP